MNSHPHKKKYKKKLYIYINTHYVTFSYMEKMQVFKKHKLNLVQIQPMIGYKVKYGMVGSV